MLYEGHFVAPPPLVKRVTPSWIVDVLRNPQDPSTRGWWIVDFPADPRDPSTRGSWIVDLPAVPGDPSTRGLWIVDLPVPSEDGPKTHGMRLKLVIFSYQYIWRKWYFYSQTTPS